MDTIFDFIKKSRLIRKQLFNIHLIKEVLYEKF